ncbi:MAG: PEP-CTERM sorting domain-containing protein [Gammaproteobacteria bacterium]
MRYNLKYCFAGPALIFGLLPSLAQASVFYLGNFDVVNDTGKTAHGFEIDLEGLHSSDITDTFGGAGRRFPSGKGYDPSTAVVRYGAPVIEDYSRADGTFGTSVIYRADWDGLTWNFGTPTGSFVTPGDNCWTGGGVGYGPNTPCDHFGVGASKTAAKTTYSWLFDDGSNSGRLVANNGQVSLPAPVITPVVAPQPGQPAPNVAAHVEAPEPANFEFGEALWVKIFKTELDRDVGLEELIGGNPIIDNAETEIEWQLLQKEFSKPNSGQLEAEYQVGANAEAEIFRYEFYKFAGLYDPETHEALFDIGFGDSNPGPNDVGTYIGAQNDGVNLNGAAVPLPPSILFMGSALFGFGVSNGRKKRPNSEF